jgi:ribonucleotide monophosphatase NagD (HAD superfamily)
LVKTGVYKGGKLDVKPDFIINSVGDMKIWIKIFSITCFLTFNDLY